METSLACVRNINFSSSLLTSRNRQQCSVMKMNNNIVSCSMTSTDRCYGRLRMRKQPMIVNQLLWKNDNNNKKKKKKKPWKLVVVNCAKSGGGGLPVEEEIITEEELLRFGRLRENCREVKENGGIADLLECLEKEAIMGDDEGKTPNDYNRRAQIFDKSSRVFQALKDNNNTNNNTTTSSS